MNQLPSDCPLCDGPIVVTRLYCPHCDVTIEGHFQTSAGPLAALTPEQVQFVLAFVRNEGRFNRLEEELRMSYPTLRNRLNEIIRALGYEPGKEEAPVRLSSQERLQVLDDLAQGRISYAEAQSRLKGEPGDGADRKNQSEK